jgi:putative transcriptional regulator
MLGQPMIRSRLKLLIYERNTARVREGRPLLTVRELAALTGLSTSVVSGLMTNRTERVDFKTLDKLCAVLDCGPGDLLERVADPAPEPAA